MEQFSLEKYLANPSRKVVIRDGRNARIICTDRRDLNFPIIALIENISGGGEKACSYTKDGRHYTDCSDIFDLFFASENHEWWVNLYKWANKDCAYYIGSMYNSKEGAENSIINNGRYLTTLKIEWEEQL